MPRFIIEKPVYLRISITASDAETAKDQADGIVDAARKLINFVELDEDAAPDVYECIQGQLYLVGEGTREAVGERCD